MWLLPILLWRNLSTMLPWFLVIQEKLEIWRSIKISSVFIMWAKNQKNKNARRTKQSLVRYRLLANYFHSPLQFNSQASVYAVPVSCPTILTHHAHCFHLQKFLQLLLPPHCSLNAFSPHWLSPAISFYKALGGCLFFSGWRPKVQYVLQGLLTWPSPSSEL